MAENFFFFNNIVSINDNNFFPAHHVVGKYKRALKPRLTLTQTAIDNSYYTSCGLVAFPPLVSLTAPGQNS